MKMFLFLFLFAVPCAAQQTFQQGGFQIQYGTEDSVYALGEDVCFHFTLTAPHSARLLHHRSSSFKLVRCEADTERVLRNSRLMFGPPEAEQALTSGTAESRNGSLIKADKRKRELDDEGFTEVLPTQSLKGGMCLIPSSYNEKEEMWYDLDTGKGTKKVLPPGNYKLYYTAVVGKMKTAVLKESVFRVEDNFVTGKE